MSEQLHPNHQRIIDTFHKDPAALIEWAAKNVIALGAKTEWSTEDNFATTELLAELPARYGLPPASDQREDAHRFYGEAARWLGYDTDLDEDEDEDQET